MPRTLSPFTRLTLMITELRDNKIADLADVGKCDLAHHISKLNEDFDNQTQSAAAGQIMEQGKALLVLIEENQLVQAENARQGLLLSCRQLKDLL